MKKTIINRNVVLGAFGVAAFLIFLTVIFGLGFSGRQATEANWKLAALTVIPGPSSTPLVGNITPTHDVAQGTPTPPLGEIAINGFVQITGTDGEGLRLRDVPGLGGNPIFLGFDTELFQVMDGPQEADGYTWWYLIAPYEEGRAGWAAADFLEPIEPEE